MVENANMGIDKKDRDLLYELDLDGRASYSELARKVKLSKQVVKYRIERLEKEGYIKGYFAMIDSSRLGYTTFRVYLKFRDVNAEKRKKVIEYFKNEKEIWAVVSLAGKWDLALGIAVRDIYGFYEVWERILKKYLTNISDYRVSIYSPIYHYSKAYITGKKDESKVRILGGKEKVDLDKKDLLILIELSKNARVSLLDLSDKVDLTAEAIAHRIRVLEKKEVIQGYRAMIDVHKLGYEFYKAEIRLSNFDNFDRIMNFCKNNPNIYQLDKTIGGETLEIEFHVKDLKEMLSIIEEMENNFKGSIERFDYLTVISEEKTTYMPEN